LATSELDTTAAAPLAPGGHLLGSGAVPRSNWSRRWRRFKQNRMSLVGFGIIVFLILVAVIGPFFAPYPKDATGAVHISERLRGPSREHLMGTDDVGRDVLTRLLVGSRLSLGAGLVVLVIATSVGLVLGIVSGYFGGKIDIAIQRVTDVFLTVPGLILAMAVSAALSPSLINVMWAISLVWWPGYCRLTRAEVLRRKAEAYVEAAQSIGARSYRIIARHIFPNILTPVLVKASMDIGFAVLTLASLGFIGLGAQPPTPDWGKMIADGRRYLPESWWLTVFPGIAIFLTVFGFNLLGDGIRDVFDPRSRD
jgi:peptide/nickel transport system permease protein